MSTLLIRNAKLVTMTSAGVIKGDLLLLDGKIAAIGEALPLPLGAKEINAHGHLVTPGLIDAHCHLGLEEDAIGFEGADGNEATSPNTAQVRGIDGYTPTDRTVREALAGGVTMVATGPGSANVIGGSFFVVKTYGDCVDEAVVMNPAAMKCAFGENPKRVYSSRQMMPSTRLGTAAVLREALAAAVDYDRKIELAKQEEKPAPERNLKLEALLPVIHREIPLKAHAHRADDILTAIRIAQEFNVKLTLDHCTEGHLMPERLAKLGYPAIVGPSFGSRTKVELANKSFTTPAVLNKAGVKVAICTDSPVLPQESLPLLAGMACAAGLPEMEALKAITLYPAQILGLDNRFGSLEVGKEADLVIWQRHPFDTGAKPSHVILNGEIVVEQ